MGRVQGPECGYQIFPAEPLRVRKPDVSFIAAERASPELLNGNARIVPDFAAEVMSPRDKADALNKKIEEYLAVGVRLVWIIFPKTRSVWIFRSDGSGQRHVGAGEITGEDVMSGFSISLDTLFAED